MRKAYTVTSPTGIHARPARLVADAASKFPCEIFVEKNGKRYNAKSLVKMIALGAKCGDEVVVVAHGEQSELAVEMVGNVLSASHASVPGGPGRLQPD